MKRVDLKLKRSSAAILSAAAIAGAGLVLSAQAREPERTAPAQAMLVLDASGSMWAEIKGPQGKTTRIETARSTITDLLNELAPETELGLIAYGHRRKGDCKDIETLIKPGPLDKAAFASKVNKLNPKGMTPLTDAVKQAAKVLRYTEQKATVILVTDGLETCAPDPCAAAEALEEAGIDFTAHVIGFGLSKAESEKLACIADRTGGRYLDAKDGAGLAEALQEVVMESGEPVEMKAEETGPWYPGEAVMPGIQMWATGRTTDAPEGHAADVTFPVNGTPEQCRAICDADQKCSSWVYEPPGSYFIEEPRCRTFGLNAEMDFSVATPDENWVSGMKPGARTLVRPLTSQPAAD